jgi:hypothetical protein
MLPKGRKICEYCNHNRKKSMGSCVENYPVENLGTIGTAMTAKENILVAFPDAYIKILVSPPDIKQKPIKIFLIIDGTSLPKAFGAGSTEEKAWESAWKMTQKKMLKILESDKI